ncbi:hypothetical protein [Legionella spiritensis]|uniref:Uncharacterized protein n=1 Tax=Legionella spiritensis TaxID=452 RepID=A0A0W0Z9L1_LEGSP|nr:hypothetical protein [Legionella spiritensis]KTD65810.1 hypothetical protein Lspi_0522 [Legionella spiritensis]SNV41189.1 Uncharacterised protein [Legionella spiritensis]
MKEFDEKLTDIVKVYAFRESEEEPYRDKRVLSEQNRQKIEALLITLFSHSLIRDGFEENSIDRNYKKLSLSLHTDKLSSATAEIKWLEHTLSNGKNDGALFKLMCYCRDELKKTPEPRDNPFNNMTTFDELIECLEQKKKEAVTLTQKALIDSLLILLRTGFDYHTTVADVPHTALRTAVGSIPYITSSICINYFIYELAMFYALAYMTSRSGKWLSTGNSGFMKTLGEQMQLFSGTLTRFVTSFVIRLLELNFLLAQSVGYVGIEVGKGVYHMLADKPKTRDSKPPEQEVDTTCTTVALSLEGRSFNTMEIKLPAMVLESYLRGVEQQWLSSWRTGNKKAAKIKDSLVQLQLIDRSSVPLPEKLRDSQKIIDNLKCNVLFEEGSTSRKTIDSAGMILEMMPNKPLSLEKTTLLCLEDGRGTEETKTTGDTVRAEITDCNDKEEEEDVVTTCSMGH